MKSISEESHPRSTFELRASTLCSSRHFLLNVIVWPLIFERRSPPSSLPGIYVFPLLPDYWCICSADCIVRQAVLSCDGSIPYYRSLVSRLSSWVWGEFIFSPCI